MNTDKAHTLLVLGGTSAIGLAYARRRLASLTAAGQPVAVILAGRDGDKLAAEAADFEARGATVTVVAGDLSDLGTAGGIGAAAFVDEAVLAYGALTDQDRAQSDDAYLDGQLATNFASAARWLEWLAHRFETQGHGRAVVIGSVAGDRGRQSNYAYGAAKAGLATFVQGLQHRFAPAGTIHFTLVKPGFVDSPMTAHIQPKGALWATPEGIAVTIERAALKGRRTVYVPWFWRLIMLIIRSVPAFVFHKTKL